MASATECVLKYRSLDAKRFTASAPMAMSPDQRIQCYFRTGEHEGDWSAWAGENIYASARLGHAALLNALVAVVRTRTAHATVPKVFVDLDVVAFTRAKITPMVDGMFPAHEQATVLDVLGRAVVFLTPANIDTVLGGMRWLRTAWDLANLYLASVEAPLLSDRTPRLVGLSEETTCYVSANYFREENRFDDFVVHEVAHIFHNCKRETIGLAEIRGREWLLEIDYAKRETFAYACEAYSRLLTLSRVRADRTKLLAELAKAPTFADDRVDIDEYLDIVRAAVAARNGWKRILQRCAPSRRSRAPSTRPASKKVSDGSSTD